MYTMNTPWIIFLLFVVAVVLLGTGCVQEQSMQVANNATSGTGREAMVQLADEVNRSILGDLSGLDLATSDAAASLGTTGLSGPEAETVLGRVLSSDPAILTVITIDRNGTVISAVPGEAEALIGENLGTQAVVRQVLSTREPLMSDIFPLAQGGYAVLIEHPVFSPGGDFTGLVSTAFLPWDLIAPVAENATAGTAYSIMVTQTDGRVLFDPDPQEIGMETLNETLYAGFPEILETARRLSAEPSGSASYSFYSTGFGKVVKKEAFWTTLGMHGTEWRVMVIREL
jgi:polar amino acid transport system substrate-binding protein